MADKKTGELKGREEIFLGRVSEIWDKDPWTAYGPVPKGRKATERPVRVTVVADGSFQVDAVLTPEAAEGISQDSIVSVVIRAASEAETEAFLAAIAAKPEEPQAKITRRSHRVPNKEEAGRTKIDGMTRRSHAADPDAITGTEAGATGDPNPRMFRSHGPKPGAASPRPVAVGAGA